MEHEDIFLLYVSVSVYVSVCVYMLCLCEYLYMC